MRNTFKLNTVMSLGLALGAGVLGGCQAHQTPLPKCAVAEFGGNDVDNQMNFWHSLSERSVTCNEDALHGLMLYFYEEDPAESYDQRVALLKKQGLLPTNWNKPADYAVERGTLAVAIAHGVQLKGGVALQVLGRDNARYTLRELQYNSVFPQGTANQTVSGTEFVGLIGRVEDYQRGNPAAFPAKNLPSEVVGQALTAKELEELESSTTQTAPAPHPEVAPEAPPPSAEPVPQ